MRTSNNHYRMQPALLLTMLFMLLAPFNALAQDTRTDVTTVAATSDMAEIFAYGKDVKKPTFTMAEGSIAYISPSMRILEKKGESGKWNTYKDRTFTEGTYRVKVQVRVDGSYGRTHKLAEGWTLTVDGQAWTISRKRTITDTSSYDWAISPEIIVKKGPATGIISVNNEKVAAKKQDAFYYNLAGQRVGNDYRGVVIHNGQKYLRK